MDWLALAACGLASGFLAGLLGIGGGLIVVPAMYLLLPHTAAPPALLPQMAVATSLAAMVPTTVTALVAQHRRGAVDLPWLRRMSPGIVVGALAGVLLLPLIDARAVAAVFVAYAGCFALRLLLAARDLHLPAPWQRWPVGLVAAAIGAVSVLAGVGGAVFTVPFLESRSLRLTHAAGTFSGVGLLLSLVAVPGLSLRSTTAAADAGGLVWWPAAAAIGACAILGAPLGVRAAHRWPVGRLRRAFALLLVGAATSALWKAQTL